MSIIPVVFTSAAILAVAYLVYARLVTRWLGVDPTRQTPAEAHADGRDYTPAPAGVVLGGHFTAIAAAGPVVGPIFAAQWFGWAPALLWILLGAIFVGAVHDSTALFASVRNRAQSITQVVRDHMSKTAYVLFLLFVWVSLIYVIVAFTDVVAGSFSSIETFTVAHAGQTGDSQTVTITGSAVAIGALAYLLCSIGMGIAVHRYKMPWLAAVLVSAGVLTGVIVLAPGLAEALRPNFPTWAATATAGELTKVWGQGLLVYCWVASLLPMWLLLQPRGVIGACFLYATLFFGLAGCVVGVLTSDSSLAIGWPAFKPFTNENGMTLFPFLFITIACGACSGFHAIVASGTSSKQLSNERDIRPVAFGGMLLEAMVAVFALSCVMILIPGGPLARPDVVYARGIGHFMQLTGIPVAFAIAFAMLAFSSFVFDTLDVCTRLARYVFQELTGWRGLPGGAAATLITLAFPSWYLWSSEVNSFRTFWTIFGTSNQLLAALTLIGVAVWLRHHGRPIWYVIIPAGFMLATTLTALAMNFWQFYTKFRSLPVDTSGVEQLTNIAVAVLLAGLAVLVAAEAVRMLRRPVPKTVAH